MKKALSVILTVCLMLPFGIYAEDDKGLSQAILHAKSVLEIPEEYSEFTYSSNEWNGDTHWQLVWSQAELALGRISATITKNGDIVSYQKTTQTRQRQGLSAVSVRKATEIAAAFLDKVLPTLSAQMRPDQNTDPYSYELSTARIRFLQYVDDIPVVTNQCTVDVDRTSGEVVGYSGFAPREIAFEPHDNIIDLHTATERYLENIGLNLTYRSHYDYNDKVRKVFPAYSTYFFEDRAAISALDGSKVVFPAGSSTPVPLARQIGQEYVSYGGSARMTEAELAAVQNVTGYITKEDAVQKIKEQVPDFPDQLTPCLISLVQDSIEKQEHYWLINFSGEKDNSVMQATVNAVDGTLLSFYIPEAFLGEVASLSYDQAQEKAAGFLRAVAPERMAQTKLKEANATARNTESALYHFTYARIVNGIECEFNSLDVLIDAKTGHIGSFYTRWNENAEFPPLDGILSKAEIMEYMKTAARFELHYNNEKLVYDFRERSYYTYDPYTGVRIDSYYGTPIMAAVLPNYSDISGHWSEEMVTLLLENGIYKETTEFRPDQAISQADFFRFVLNIHGPNNEEMYDYLLEQGYLTQEEADMEGPVTRQQAAKVFTKLLGYDEIASHSEIFVCPFGDEVAPAYRGYVTICNLYGIISGDQDGNFNGTYTITNAETAAMIYHYRTHEK